MAIILLPPQTPPPPLLLPVCPQPVAWPPSPVDEEDFDSGVPGGLDFTSRLFWFLASPFSPKTTNNEISRWIINHPQVWYIYQCLNRTIIKFLPWMFVVGLLICPPPLGEWALSPTLSVSFCVMKSCISSKFSGQYIPSNFVFPEFLDHHLNYFLWYSFSICSYQYRHMDLKSVRAPWEVED